MEEVGSGTIRLLGTNLKTCSDKNENSYRNNVCFVYRYARKQQLITMPSQRTVTACACYATREIGVLNTHVGGKLFIREITLIPITQLLDSSTNWINLLKKLATLTIWLRHGRIHSNPRNAFGSWVPEHAKTLIFKNVTRS